MKVYVVYMDGAPPIINVDEFDTVEDFKQQVREGNYRIREDSTIVAGTRIEVKKTQPAPVYKFEYEPLKQTTKTS